MRKAGMTVWALSVAVLGMTGSLYALDVADVVREWTPEGKKLAMERAKLPAHDEMIRIPAGEFLMGSTPEQVDTMLKQQTVRWEQALKKIKIDKE